MSGALVEGTTLAFLGLCAAGQRPACDGELDGAVRWRVRGGECVYFQQRKHFNKFKVINCGTGV